MQGRADGQEQARKAPEKPTEQEPEDYRLPSRNMAGFKLSRRLSSALV